jgi:hypothetical protein
VVVGVATGEATGETIGEVVRVAVGEAAARGWPAAQTRSRGSESEADVRRTI